MSGFGLLAHGIPRWSGQNSLHDPHGGGVDVSPTALQISPMLAGRFLRLDYVWQYRGRGQEGSLLLGEERATGRLNAYWIDSWHMGDSGMLLQGESVEGVISLFGRYAAPPGPDWGWRMEIAPGATALQIRMANVTPEGEESPAVEARYAPA